MIQIYYSQLPAAFSKKKWITYFQQMPDDIRQRIHRYRKIENKYQLVVGRLLLKYGMQQLGFNDFQLRDLYYDKNNCPLWREDIHFNIAHSGNIVACAFSKKDKIGIDIEKIRQINLNDFDYILNKIDQQAIAKTSNSIPAFFQDMDRQRSNY